MKYILYISLGLIGMVAFISCGKTVYNRILKGHLVDINTGLPIASAGMTLEGVHYTGPGLFSINNISEIRNDYAVSLSDGSFEFNYRKGRDFYYTIFTGYVDYFFEYRFDVGRYNLDNNLELKLEPCAKIIFDVNKVSNAKLVNMKFQVKGQGSSLSGSKIQEYIQQKVEGNKNLLVTYFIYDINGSYKKYDTSIYCPTYKSTTLRIDY